MHMSNRRTANAVELIAYWSLITSTPLYHAPYPRPSVPIPAVFRLLVPGITYISNNVFAGGWRGPTCGSWNSIPGDGQNFSHRPPQSTKRSQQSYTRTLTTLSLVLSTAARVPSEACLKTSIFLYLDNTPLCILLSKPSYINAHPPVRSKRGGERGRPPGLLQ